MQILKQQKLITCILPHGRGFDMLEKLKEEKQVMEANINTARGMGHLTPLAHRGVGEQSEKDILTVVVSTERADEIFEFLYERAEINRPHGGIIFMAALDRQTPFLLPDIPDSD